MDKWKWITAIVIVLLTIGAYFSRDWKYYDKEKYTIISMFEVPEGYYIKEILKNPPNRKPLSPYYIMYSSDNLDNNGYTVMSVDNVREEIYKSYKVGDEYKQPPIDLKILVIVFGVMLLLGLTLYYTEK